MVSEFALRRNLGLVPCFFSSCLVAKKSCAVVRFYSTAFVMIYALDLLAYKYLIGIFVYNIYRTQME